MIVVYRIMRRSVRSMVHARVLYTLRVVRKVVVVFIRRLYVYPLVMSVCASFVVDVMKSCADVHMRASLCSCPV